MGPGRHLVSYPLRGGTLRNIVAVEERRHWAEESWTLRDDPHGAAAGLRGLLCPASGAGSTAVETVHLLGLVPPSGRRPMARPERAAILGDAAHPTLPFLAQGANMALEDAWVLAQCLATHDTPDAALCGLSDPRRARVARVVEASTANARAYHLHSPWRDVAHLGCGSRAGSRHAHRCAASTGSTPTTSP